MRNIVKYSMRDLYLKRDQNANITIYYLSLNNIESQVTLFFKKYSWNFQVLNIKVIRIFKVHEFRKNSTSLKSEWLIV